MSNSYWRNNNQYKKHWYKSKTLWANMVAIIIVIIEPHIGLAITPAMHAGFLSTLNILLRLVTKDEVGW